MNRRLLTLLISLSLLVLFSFLSPMPVAQGPQSSTPSLPTPTLSRLPPPYATPIPSCDTCDIPLSDTQPPTVNWIAPVGNGEIYYVTSGTVGLEVSATDDSSGVNRVEFRRWDWVNEVWVEISVDYSPPYQASVDVSTLNMTWNQVTAKVFDNAGNLAADHIWIYRTFSCSNVTEIPQIECEALVALYNSTNGPGWTRNDNWLQNNQPSTWYGVATKEGSVYYLFLDNNQLSGNIPPQIGNLNSLEILHLDNNQLSGSIPSQIENLSKLQVLVLNDNQLTGTIPLGLGNLNLGYLFLENNQLSGRIPLGLQDSFMILFQFHNTNLCVPKDAAFQDWLANVFSVSPAREDWTICQYLPSIDGWGFENRRAISHWDVFRDTFGHNHVPADLNQARKEILYYFNEVYTARNEGGICFGMVASSMIKYQGNDWVIKDPYIEKHWYTPTISLEPPPLTFAQEEVDQRYRQGKTYDFTVRHHVYQDEVNIRKFINEYALDPAATIALIRASIDSGLNNPYILGIWWNDGGHAVMPYDYEVFGDLVHLKVYDPNYPSFDTVTFVFNTIDNSWSFLYDQVKGIYWGPSFSGECFWESDSDLGFCFPKIAAIPINMLSGAPIPPWTRYSTFDYMLVHFSNAAGNITDNEGNTTGQLPDGTMVERSPYIKSRADFTLNVGGSLDYIVEANAPTPIEIATFYTKTVTSKLYIEAGGGAALIESDGHANTTNKVVYSREFQSDHAFNEVFLTAGSTGNHRISLVDFTETRSSDTTISNLMINEGGSVYVLGAFTDNFQSFTIFNNSTNTLHYTLELTQHLNGAIDEFVATGIPMNPNDSHIGSIDWLQQPDTVRILVDQGSNGSIDETIVLENGRDYGDGNRIFLPLIVK